MPIMAITRILVVVALFGALTDGSMGHKGYDNSEEDWLQVHYSPPLQLPQPPALPGFPQIYLPQPPPIPFITFGKNKPRAPHMPHFPHVPFMPFIPQVPMKPDSFPDVEDMLKEVPKPGVQFTGVAISQTMNSDGEGIAEFASNTNGEVVRKKIYYPAKKHE